MPFEPPACERGHDTDYGKAGSGEEKSECLVLAQKAELFTEPGSVSGNREERFLPAFPTYHICPSEGVGGPSGMGASAVVCSPA